MKRAVALAYPLGDALDFRSARPQDLIVAMLFPPRCSWSRRPCIAAADASRSLHLAAQLASSSIAEAIRLSLHTMWKPIEEVLHGGRVIIERAGGEQVEILLPVASGKRLAGRVSRER